MTLSDEVASVLAGYKWPGNIRELSHVIERAVILCQENVLLGSHIMLSEKHLTLTETDDKELRSLDDIELEMIKKALNKYQGHISKAASAIGISRNAMYRRMEKYQLHKEDFDIE
jgi:transcriptional regulator of acetoin/glycerol metabolism